MHTFRKNGFIKVKIHLNLLEKINFYQCELTTTQNMKNIKEFRSPVSTVVLKIPVQQHFCLIIVIDTNPENIEISFFCQYRTPLVLTQNYLQWLLCHVQCRQPQAVGLFRVFFFFFG